MADAYPLQWPEGWPRTPAHRREWGKFRGTQAQATQTVLDEIARLGGRYPVISTDIPIRKDGLPYASAREPADPGVAVYFEREGKQVVFACDKFDRVWKNLRAIAKTIDAIRGIERWGASDMMERALTAFEALPPPPSWKSILGFDETERPPADAIKSAFAARAKKAHPDTGGSAAEFQNLISARDAGLREVEAQ